jgi:hypothetical protein
MADPIINPFTSSALAGPYGTDLRVTVEVAWPFPGFVAHDESMLPALSELSCDTDLFFCARITPRTQA